MRNLARAALLGAALVQLCGSARATDKGLVIRGGQCSADAFIKGAESGDEKYISGLSANCTTATQDKAQYVNYIAGMGVYAQYCVAQLAGLQLRNVVITNDPTQADPLHCKLAGKPADIAAALTKYP